MAPPETLQGLRPRFAQGRIEETLVDTPITVVQGARQVGKSTLVRQVVQGRDARVVSLDATPAFNAAISDPDAFVRQTSGLLVIDEVQRAPQLMRAMKDAVDEDRRPGRFLVTGSADLLSLAGAESLAGRAESIPLNGLSQGELRGTRENLVDQVFSGDESLLSAHSGSHGRDEYLQIVCAGSYPEALSRLGRGRGAWFDNYVKRIVSRDALDVSRLTQLDKLPALLRLLAANNAGELVKARIGGDVGIAQSTLPSYIDLLETLYLVHYLPAWGNNLTKRVVGRPKVALLDTGLAARLNNVTPSAMAPGVVSDAARGLFEAFVAGEVRRQLVWADVEASMFHFRDRNGKEVDLVLEAPDRRVVGLEVKASGNVSRADFAGLTFMRDTLGERFMSGVVFHTGTQALPFGRRLWALPYSALWSSP